ncbi:MAG: sensor histidine kinase [Stenotrophomonas sp.]|nr:sensor histidine kinase [Stenotrophomonas sp.]
MIASLWFCFRILVAWALALIVLGIVWAQVFGDPGAIFALLVIGVLAMAAISAASHLHRVKLTAGRLDHDSLSSRQRRQIELPFDAGQAFALVESVIAGLPRVTDIESSPGSLQLRAKLVRVDPYNMSPPSRWNPRSWLAIKRNQVSATVTPGQGTSSVSLLFEPEAGAWADLLIPDEGSNRENAEAVSRAMSRRVAELRRDERETAERTEAEKELSVARLNLLHAQVEPHFLYNTLANAQVLTRTDPERAERMLGHLIQYLRSSLPGIDQSLSTLGQELERVQAYLEILRIRMGARLAVRIDVPEALQDVVLPSMALQTLVENAIKHGLEPKPGGGTIWVLAREADGQVHLTVADDGQGVGGSSGGGTGIGLKNLRERLRLGCGAQAGFALVSNFPSGAAATITLPRRPPTAQAAAAAAIQVPELPHAT